MASLEKRGETWRLVFMWKGRKRNCTLLAASAEDAMAHKADAEMRLRLLKQGITDLRGASIEDYILHRGHPPDAPIQHRDNRSLTLALLYERYMASATVRRLETPTQTTARTHWRHILRILGRRQPLIDLSQRDLQRYVEIREKDRMPPIEAETIKKELKTLKSAWNWAVRMEDFPCPWPGKYLVYQKGDEPMAYLTLGEAHARISEGVSSKDVYESVYLLPAEIAEILAFVRVKRLPPWVYPMFVFAAHTGARRSEILRAVVSDVSREHGRITIREKKRIPGKRSTRTVPLTPLLGEALAPLLKTQGAIFRGKNGKGLMLTSARKYFHKALAGSPWSALRGWHTFRHSFISSLAASGTDQRIIDDLVGHSTDEQRRRYRHLLPNVTAAAVMRVFGG